MGTLPIKGVYQTLMHKHQYRCSIRALNFEKDCSFMAHSQDNILKRNTFLRRSGGVLVMHKFLQTDPPEST